MDIYERIKYLRKVNLKLNQEDFGNKIGISRSNVANIELGRINLTERVLTDICREFNINEEWLRNGTGEMFLKEDKYTSLDEYLKKYKISDFELDTIKAYLDIPEELRRPLIDSFKANLLESHKKKSIDEELEAYRKELEAEQKGKISSASESQKENLG